MFTGLVKGVGQIVSLAERSGGRRIGVDVSALEAAPAVGASVAVSGACLTVTGVNGRVADFDAVAETVRRTKLGRLAPGDRVNLEPSLRVGDPLDGHIVQGHVDAVGRLLEVRREGEARIFRFSLPETIERLVAEKGSIAVDGISLTVVEAAGGSFTVSIIPHTLAHTTLPDLQPGGEVNLEADVLARYAARFLGGADGVTEQFLREHGFA